MTARRRPQCHPGNPLPANGQGALPVLPHIGPRNQSSAKNRRDRAPGPICAGSLAEWSGRWHSLPASKRADDEQRAILGEAPEIKGAKK